METFKKAKEIASDKLFFIDGLASLRDAVKLMKEKNVQALIIKKRNNADANGIITVNDIIKGVIIPDKTLDEVSVYEIMTKPVFSISAHLNIKYVPRLMYNYNVRIAPVEENGEYIGIIDYTQFLFAKFQQPGNHKSDSPVILVHRNIRPCQVLRGINILTIGQEYLEKMPPGFQFDSETHGIVFLTHQTFISRNIRTPFPQDAP